MRTVFIHGETELFSEAKTTLIDRFIRWHPDAEGETAAPLIELLLDEKFTHDGLLARWTPLDLIRFLTVSGPRRLLLQDNWSAVPETLHQWVDFLDDSGLLITDTSVQQLHEAVEGAIPGYLLAMSEPSAWPLAKFWWVTMREHGVDSADSAAQEEFFEAVSEGEVTVDDTIVDALEDGEAAESGNGYALWLPPVDVPDEELPSHIPDTPTLERMRALHDWLGAGRQLDADGGLSSSDLDDLAAAAADGDGFVAEVLLAWAKHAELVREVGDRLVPTVISAGLLEQAGLLWSRLWQAFVLLDDVIADELPEETFASMVRESLGALYSQTDAIPVEVLVDAVALSSGGDPENREALREVLLRVLDQWEELGAVRRYTTTDPDEIAAIDEGVSEETATDYTMVELSTLGLWAARHTLRALGFVAPTVDELVEYPAEVLALVLASSVDVEDAATRWIEHRGAKEASVELADLLRRVDDPVIRLSVLWMLEQTGEDGVAAAVGLSDDPVAGPAARVWLQSRPTTSEVTVTPDDELVFLLDGMTVSAQDDVEHFLTEFQAAPTADQVAMVERISRVRHVGALTVLEAIAENHPDERVTQAAERSLETVRS